MKISIYILKLALKEMLVVGHQREQINLTSTKTNIPSTH